MGTLPVRGCRGGGQWGRELTARVAPGLCRSEPHPAATPWPVAPVNKARRTSRRSSPSLGLAWEFLPGPRRAAEASSGREDSEHPLSALGRSARGGRPTRQGRAELHGARSPHASRGRRGRDRAGEGPGSPWGQGPRERKTTATS